MQKAYLEELPLFKDLTLEDKAELEALFEPTSFEAREAILKEDGPENYLYVLTSGVVEVSKEVFLGRLQHLATVEAPTVVGEIGLMTKPQATATITARGPVEARRLPHEAFVKTLETDSEAAYKVVCEIGRILAERMARTEELVRQKAGCRGSPYGALCSCTRTHLRAGEVR